MVLFICFQLDSASEVVDFWFYCDLVIAFLIFISLFSYSISVFSKQRKFNKSTPKNYISLVNPTLFKINEQFVIIKDIENVSYEKTHKWELFGDIEQANIGTPVSTRYKFQEEIAKNAAKKAKSNYEKAIQKSNLGTIVIELKSAEKIILKRVNNVEDAVKKIKDIVNQNTK